MDVPRSYDMSLKKDGLFINLSTDDVYFISKQMDKWFRILLDDSYVPVSLPQRPQPEATLPAPPVAPVEPVAPPSPVVAPSESLPVAPAPVAAPPATEPPPAPLPEPVVTAAPISSPEPPPSIESVSVMPEPAISETLSTASELPEAPPVIPAEAAPMPAPMPVAPPAPIVADAAVVTPPASTSPAPPKDDFESVMDTVMRDLEAPPTLLPMAPPSPVQDEVPLAGNSLKLDMINSLADLCDQAQAGSSEDFLLLASYYISQIELQERFSLKLINSNLVKSGFTPVNHSTLEAVLDKGHLSMVPDLNGTAEVSEYSITQDGLNSVSQLF